MSKEKLNTLDELSVNGTGDIFTNKQHTLQIEHRKPEEYKVHIWGYELCNGAEWQDFLDVVNKLGKEKADLEAKLVESESEIKEWIAVRDDKNNVINKQTEKINQLKQQLAEKEKEIESKQRTINALQNGLCVDLLNKEMLELRNQHQEKIEFAIEQLEKVQKYMVTDEKDMFGMPYLMKSDYVLDFIDNLINELKEGK